MGEHEELTQLQDFIEKKWTEIEPLERPFSGKSVEWEGDDGLFYKIEAQRDPF